MQSKYNQTSSSAKNIYIHNIILFIVRMQLASRPVQLAMTLNRISGNNMKRCLMKVIYCVIYLSPSLTPLASTKSLLLVALISKLNGNEPLCSQSASVCVDESDIMRVRVK